MQSGLGPDGRSVWRAPPERATKTHKEETPIIGVSFWLASRASCRRRHHHLRHHQHRRRRPKCDLRQSC